MTTRADLAEPLSLEFTIPIRTSRGKNTHEHHFARARRVKRERTTAAMVTRSEFARAAMSAGAFGAAVERITITMTRVSPWRGTKPDNDNVNGALAHIRDGIADALYRNDGDDSLDWQYRQERGPWGVRVKIEAR